jgi:hypothetical protein
MSRAISAMLDQPEHLVKRVINKLEDKNGYPSHDVRALAENIQKIRAKISDLGLDPDDTTAQELYHALHAKFDRDSRKFDEQFSLVGPSDNQPATLATRMVSKNFELPECWYLKSSAVKKLLRIQPPKKLMRRLNYRSVDSLLKRENLSELCLAAAYTESSVWHKGFDKLVSGLDSTAFEMRPLSLVSLSREKWGEFQTDEQVAYNNEFGVLGTLPGLNVSALSAVILLLDALAALSELKISESASKLSQELVWWSDMDGLIANLASEHVSMSLSDVSKNHVRSHDFTERVMEAGRLGFWRDLLSRYQNQLIPDEDLNISFSHLLNLKAPINQPAFDYVEDI